MPAETVHLVAGEAQAAVFRDHVGVALRVGGAIEGVVLRAVDLENNTRTSGEQEEEPHLRGAGSYDVTYLTLFPGGAEKPL